MHYSLIVLNALSTATLGSAFSTLITQTVTPSFISNTKRSALIFGWDGDNVEEEDATSFYADESSGVTYGGAGCSTAGIEIADNLRNDQDKLSSLARLAVAFSPPDRKVSLQRLDRVDVVCVSEDHIELEAMLCEDSGCVSLMVPVKFPNHCESSLEAQWLEGCVRHNLEALDVQVGSTVIVQGENSNANDSVEDLFKLDAKLGATQYPSWWVAPESVGWNSHEFVSQCHYIVSLLNEDEFQNNLLALAFQGLKHVGEETLYTFKKAKVMEVGPTGIYLKVAARNIHTRNDLHIIDVMYPFGSPSSVQAANGDFESLNASVLGAIADAENIHPSSLHP